MIRPRFSQTTFPVTYTANTNIRSIKRKDNSTLGTCVVDDPVFAEWDSIERHRQTYQAYRSETWRFDGCFEQVRRDLREEVQRRPRWVLATARQS
jgi:hypothetical protein